jgi:type I restriction enzyme S subunit
MDSNNWQSFLKGCLDILRNGDSKYDGLKAINEFITLITLKLVENRISDEVVNNNNISDNNIKIGIDCTFTHLYNNYCKVSEKEKKRKALDLYDLLYNSSRVFDIEQNLDDDCNVISENRTRNNKKECIIVRFNKYTDSLCKLTDNINDITSLTSFTSDHCFDIQKLIIKIYETFDGIDMEHFNYDAFGNAYEKMMTDELGNGSKRSGQYFTRRDLIDLINNELDIKPTDICYDPSCGTGGFCLGFGEKYKDDENFINNNIYGQEYLYEVYKTLNFNILANNMDGMLKNITKGDSIRDIDYHQKILNKFDVVGANPPFGISIDKCHSDYPIKKIKNSVALFLQHIYFSLKDGGRAGIIIDRGILNNATDIKLSKSGKQSNAWERDLRKFLLEKTNIYKIINLPTGIFKHTNFATSVIFFVKGTPTKEIKYIEGYFKDEDKGNSDKPMYLGQEKIVTIEQIIEKNYSLKYDDFFKEKEIKENSDRWIKLGDVCDLNRGKILTIAKIINGNYPVIGGGQKPMGYHNEYNKKEDCILISSSGAYAGYLSKYKERVWASDCFSIEPKNNKINENYLWYFLKLNQESIYKLQHGNGQPHVNTTDMETFLVPNITLQHQQEIVEFLDEIYKTIKIEDTIKYMKDKPIFNLLISKNYDTFRDVIIFNQDRIQFLMSELKNIPKMKRLQIQSIFNSLTVRIEKQKLGDIIEYLPKKLKLKAGDGKLNGNYRFYSSSQNKILFYDEYEFKEQSILLGRGGSPSIHLAEKFCISHDDVYVIKPKKNININYLYLFIFYNKNLLNFTGNGLKHLSKENINIIKISVPSLEKQQEIVQKIDELNLDTSHYNQYQKILQTELDNIIEIITNMTLLCDTNVEEKLDENINDDDELENSDSEEKETEYEKIEIKGKDYYLIDEEVYTITNNEKDKLYGYYKNDKFKKIKKESESIEI